METVVYIKNIKCNTCKSTRKVKAGVLKGKQRYKCKACNSYYVPVKSNRKNQLKKQRAIQLYLEGMAIRGISKHLKVSHTSIINWIKQKAFKVKPMIPLKARYIEMDELYLYIKNKNRKRWLWVAICRETKRILGFQLGGRSISTFKKLYHKIEPIECEYYFTDKHFSYEAVLPSKKHKTTKGGTNAIEGINSAIRHYLARFRRRSKCYSKSEGMVNTTLKLLMDKYNSKGNIGKYSIII